MSDLIDIALDGVLDRCKQAQLSAFNTELVCGCIVEAIASRANTKSASNESDWRDKLYEYALKVPTPVMTGALSGLASVPLTAAFGRRDESGKNKYLRNAMLAAAGGAALPYVYRPRPVARFEADRQYNKGIRGVAGEANTVLSELDAVKQTLPKDFSQLKTDDERKLYQELYDLENKYITGVVDPAAKSVTEFGAPSSRWRYLMTPVSESNQLPPSKFTRLEQLLNATQSAQ